MRRCPDTHDSSVGRRARFKSPSIDSTDQPVDVVRSADLMSKFIRSIRFVVTPSNAPRRLGCFGRCSPSPSPRRAFQCTTSMSGWNSSRPSRSSRTPSARPRRTLVRPARLRATSRELTINERHSGKDRETHADGRLQPAIDLFGEVLVQRLGQHCIDVLTSASFPPIRRRRANRRRARRDQTSTRCRAPRGSPRSRPRSLRATPEGSPSTSPSRICPRRYPRGPRAARDEDLRPVNN